MTARPLRLLHVTHQYAPAIGGAERYITDLSETLVARGHAVDVFTSAAVDGNTWRDTLPAREQINGVNVRRFHSRPRARAAWRLLEWGKRQWQARPQRRQPLAEAAIWYGNGPVLPGLAPAILRRASDYELVHISQLHYAHALSAYRAAKARGLPVVLTPHLHVEQPETYAVGYMRAMLKGADAVLAVSGAEAEFLVREGLSTRVVVGGNGLVMERFPPHNREVARARFGLGKDDFVVLFLGRKTAYKGLEMALRAVQSLHQAGPRIRILAVGPETEYSRALWAAQPDLAHITIRDRVSDDERLAALTACDVLALPSVGEAFGIVYLEAWAYAKPVIGADIEAVRLGDRPRRQRLLGRPARARRLGPSPARVDGAAGAGPVHGHGGAGEAGAALYDGAHCGRGRGNVWAGAAEKELNFPFPMLTRGNAPLDATKKRSVVAVVEPSKFVIPMKIGIHLLVAWIPIFMGMTGLSGLGSARPFLYTCYMPVVGRSCIDTTPTKIPMQISLLNVNLVGRDAVGQNLIHQLRFFQRRGDDVQIFVESAPDGVPEDVRAATRVVTMGDLLARRDEHFATSDLYIYHYPGRYTLLESIKRLDRGAVIFCFHNVTPPDMWGHAEQRAALEHDVAGISKLAPYADLLVTVSPFNAAQLVADHSVDPARVHTVPLAVPLDRFRPGPPSTKLLDQHQLDGQRVILFVGRMAHNKRVDLLIQALPRVREQVPTATLLLVGDDRSNDAFRENVAAMKVQAEHLGVADAVLFTGPVADLPPYYQLADVYATASLHEGFGVPLLEAMASGVPVVASEATAHPWVAGEAALLVPPEDVDALAASIVRVLKEEALRTDLVRRGLGRAAEFSSERYNIRWAEAVHEATQWLPRGAYPKPLSEDGRAKKSAGKLNGNVQTRNRMGEYRAKVTDELLQDDVEQLAKAADVMQRDYVVHSDAPLVGALIAWVRRNLTSHLREPYIDPTLRRQETFNWQAVQMVRALVQRQTALEAEIAALRARLMENTEEENTEGDIAEGHEEL